MRPSDRYTYEQAGFNSFMLRSMKSNGAAQTLRSGISAGSGSPIAFDRQQLSGPMGDKLPVGKRLVLDGSKGRMIVKDESGNEETGWVGNLVD